MTLMANKTVMYEQFTQLISRAVKHSTIGKCLLHLQMALSAMSFVDNVKYVQHVENNTPRLLVLKNGFWRAIKRFSFLNHILLDVIIPKVVFLVVSPEFICIGVGWQSILRKVLSPQFLSISMI
jgi:hypothetical protein